MTDINLLPIEFSQSNESIKRAGSIKKFIIIASGLFLVIVLIGIGLIVLLTRQVQDIAQNEGVLRQKIQSLQTSEQQLFLIKDRIQKTNAISIANVSVEKSFQTLNTVVGNLPQNTAIDDIEIDSGKTLFTVTGKDSLSTATFLNNLVASGTYKNLNLKNFLFSSDTGYQVTLQTI